MLFKSKSASKKSFGTKITKDRIELVKHTLGLEAHVETIDLEKTSLTGTIPDTLTN